MKKKSLSPAIQHLSFVWKNMGHRQGHSLDRINHGMGEALRFAITYGIEFAEGDWAYMDKHFRPGYWWDIEHYYTLACGESAYGKSPSAFQTIEHYLGRKPFLVQKDMTRIDTSASSTRQRLYVGLRLEWVDFRRTKPAWSRVRVTSFAADQSSLTACSYKPGTQEGKIDRRFKITHDDIAEVHAKLRELRKDAKKA